ncbi:MAG: GNAT family N-acetyltransferase [Desulfobacterales bacterium]|nr:GNAT family N-acetyltransferase [Desulfobacterales bacterium]
MLMQDFDIQVTEDPQSADVEIIKQGSREYNRDYLPDINMRNLAVFLRDGKGKVLGEIVGVTRWTTLYIEDVWLTKEVRGQGWGTKLMESAERHALRMGCTFVELGTFDFQARPFYENLGYVVVDTKRDSPPGRESYWMRKALTTK